MATVTQSFDPLGARIFSTVQAPELVQSSGTNFPVAGYAFDGAGATIEAIFFEGFAANYGASNPNITILVDFYAAATATSGGVVFQAALSKTTPASGSSILAQSFPTATAASAVTTVTLGLPLRATITLTSTGLNGITANDEFCLKLLRDPANAGDTFGADAVVYGVQIQYSDT